ncbi:two-component sensor histidine kinase [Paenibacillus sp. FSL H8-0548]|uniref:sensor histidine kinase n=1 Tax=Paenibacillus sp. FSL H8-0548 TaxID=1920422 RepID=UPI00096FADDF|nr:histidine kinase [Paenibacillus sp. FSL H8-0548]OMF37970.1 two-component sensor histidine kinase [Paenibacillus sp. FSL H8-0548]
MRPWQDISFPNSIFIRLITTFLLIMIPIFLLGLYIYNWSVKTAKEDITKSAETQVSTYQSDLENELERMKLLLYDSINDSNLNKLSVTWSAMGNVKRTESINLVQDRLTTIQNSSAYIRNVSAHVPSTGKSISSKDGAYTFDEERYYSLQTVFGQGAKLIVWHDGLHISASRLSGTKGVSPLFVVEIELETGKLWEALGQFNAYPGSGSYLMVKDTSFSLRTGSDIENDFDYSDIALRLGAYDGASTASINIKGNSYLFTQSTSELLELTIGKYIPEHVILQPIDRFYIWAWVFVLTAVLIIVVYTLSTYKFIHKPLLTLVKSFRRMENGDFNIEIKHAHNDEFRYLYSRFNHMVENLRNLIDRVYKQEIMTQRAELKQLQSQINPHFLYNSFFILNTMARTKDFESVEQFTMQLGEYFQFITRNASDDISLREEIHHARIYTNIQAFRFSRRIKVLFDPLPEDMEFLAVPRLIVQPIIENSFEHSLEKMKNGGQLCIRFESTEEAWNIVVEDNGNSMNDQNLMQLSRAMSSSEPGAETTGLINIHRRLVLSFGDQSGLRVVRSGLGGLRVDLCIPKERRMKHV